MDSMFIQSLLIVLVFSINEIFLGNITKDKREIVFETTIRLGKILEISSKRIAKTRESDELSK